MTRSSVTAGKSKKVVGDRGLPFSSADPLIPENLVDSTSWTSEERIMGNSFPSNCNFFVASQPPTKFCKWHSNWRHSVPALTHSCLIHSLARRRPSFGGGMSVTGRRV
jgi:hypothetical protein